MKIKKYALRMALAAAVTAVALVSAEAQFRRGGFGRRFSSPDLIPYEHRAEQEMMEKALNPEFREDTFTFARLIFSDYEGTRQFGGGRLWDDDSPDADLNATYRLHMVTSLKVRPGLKFINITAKELNDYPFVYLAAAGRVVFTDDRSPICAAISSTAGFLMADDFWGDVQWEHFREQMRRVLPGREPVEITLDHRIFHTVFDFKKAAANPQRWRLFEHPRILGPRLALRRKWPRAALLCHL